MPQPSERPVDLSAADDPVEGFRAAHTARTPVVLRTSGSGTAVVRDTVSWVASFDHVSRLTGMDRSSRIWVPGPSSASMNVFARVHAAYAGAAAATDAADATHATLTPAGLVGLLDAGAPHDLVVVVAGDRLPAALGERARAAGLRVHHYYGAAELSFVAWGSHADDLHPFPGTRVEIRSGEVWVHSPYLCLGYDGPPGPLRRATDGSASVGDRGRLEGGRLLVDGRPDAVTTGGSTIPVADVERVLAPCARGGLVVTGTPHAILGAVLTVVLTDPDDRVPLARVAREQLAPAARPRVWLHVAALPLAGSGKVDRAAVARLAALAGSTGPDVPGAPDAPDAPDARGAPHVPAEPVLPRRLT